MIQDEQSIKSKDKIIGRVVLISFDIAVKLRCISFHIRLQPSWLVASVKLNEFLLLSQYIVRRGIILHFTYPLAHMYVTCLVEDM